MINMDELPSQMVEELGMGRSFSQGTEVVHGGHQSSPEEVMPDPVDPDAGHQRVGRIGQLTSQL